MTKISQNVVKYYVSPTPTELPVADEQVKSKETIRVPAFAPPCTGKAGSASEAGSPEQTLELDSPETAGSPDEAQNASLVDEARVYVNKNLEKWGYYQRYLDLQKEYNNKAATLKKSDPMNWQSDTDLINIKNQMKSLKSKYNEVAKDIELVEKMKYYIRILEEAGYSYVCSQGQKNEPIQSILQPPPSETPVE